jgi:hypothetical protein
MDFKLVVKHSELAGDHTTNCDRNDLVEFIPELDFWKNIKMKSLKKLLIEMKNFHSLNMTNKENWISNGIIF